jgi:hypothetical protein
MPAAKSKLEKMGILVLCLTVMICITVTSGYAQKGGVLLPDYYPKKFDGFGSIDQIGGDLITIDERQMRLSKNITYHTPQYEFASKRDFRAKMFVGYIVNSDREIVSLWIIKNEN